MSWDCFGTLCLAMTKGACLAMTKMFRNVVRGFSLVRTTLKGRTTKGGCLAMTKGACLAITALFVIASEAWQSHRWCAA